MNLIQVALFLVIAQFVSADVLIAEGPARVTIPKRFIIQEQAMGDEGTIGGVMLDTRSHRKINFRINEQWVPTGKHPTKVDWSKVLYFERSPKGWYDWQIFVLDAGASIQVEARYMFQQCLFSMKLPKGAAYGSSIAALKVIKVELEEGFELIRGERFDQYELNPPK